MKKDNNANNSLTNEFDPDSTKTCFVEEPAHAYATNNGEKTLDDYIALPEGSRIEMIDGTFYDMSAPTTIHMQIVGTLHFYFKQFVDDHGGPCVPFLAPTDVQLDSDNKTVVQPDVFIICDKNRKMYPWIVGAPDLVVEVVSPSNRQMDVIRKRYKYEHAGVREYWMVFPEEKTITVCLFAANETKNYTFEDTIPVWIWDGKCEIDFKKIYNGISFLYDQVKGDEAL